MNTLILTNTIESIDLRILNYIQDHLHTPFFDKVMLFLTHLGQAGGIWIAIALVLICIKSQRKAGIYLLIGILITTVIGEFVLKNLIARPRPCHAYPIENMLVAIPTSYSLPSGHTFISFISATFIALTYRNVSIPIFCLAGLVSFSRLYLYLHYPTDILAGMVLGMVIGLASFYCSRKSPFFPNSKCL